MTRYVFNNCSNRIFTIKINTKLSKERYNICIFRERTTSNYVMAIRPIYIKNWRSIDINAYCSQNFTNSINVDFIVRKK